MSRKKREWYPGAVYHVMSRGNRRGALFKDEDDYITFLMHVDRVRATHPFKVHACCLMTNHFHMLIETMEKELSKIMQKILHSYSMDFNYRHKYSGHVFESRYIDCIIKDERYFLEVSRYIHLNPVKALMVHNPLDYQYGSYGQYVAPDQVINKRVTPLLNEIVETSRVLGVFAHNSREQYRMFVEGKISHWEKEDTQLTMISLDRRSEHGGIKGFATCCEISEKTERQEIKEVIQAGHRCDFGESDYRGGKNR